MGVEDTEDALISAINTGEILNIIYWGGSKPGASRQIQPRAIYDDKIRALDIESGRNKQFLIRKIQITDKDIPQPEYVPDIYHRKANISELISYHCAEAEKLGWVVFSTDSSISLHLKFKNGKTRKTPEVSIYYCEYITDLVYDWDGNEIEERRKAARPWHTGARSFKKPQKAFEAFWAEATTKAPSPG